MNKFKTVSAAAILGVGVLAAAGAMALSGTGAEESELPSGDGAVSSGVCAPGHPDCEDTLVQSDGADTDGNVEPYDGEDSPRLAPACAPGHPNGTDTLVLDKDGTASTGATDDASADIEVNKLEVPDAAATPR